jgi:hypothetical protein
LNTERIGRSSDDDETPNDGSSNEV